MPGGNGNAHVLHTKMCASPVFKGRLEDSNWKHEDAGTMFMAVIPVNAGVIPASYIPIMIEVKR
mgnify:CR=1 FL=1